MQNPGPALEPLLHRLTECPPEFLRIALPGSEDGTDVIAVVCDLLRPLTSDSLPELAQEQLAELRGRTETQLKVISILCWLLRDDWFQSRPQLALGIWLLFGSARLRKLTEFVRPDKFVSDPDRREELIRTCLAELQFRPEGESVAQASDRLTTLDSVERDRVLRGTAVAERRAREIREAMARKKAEESASRFGE